MHAPRATICCICERTRGWLVANLCVMQQATSVANGPSDVGRSDDNQAHLKQLEGWLRSYKPEELFDKEGRLIAELKALAPKGPRPAPMHPRKAPPPTACPSIAATMGSGASRSERRSGMSVTAVVPRARLRSMSM